MKLKRQTTFVLRGMFTTFTNEKLKNVHYQYNREVLSDLGSFRGETYRYLECRMRREVTDREQKTISVVSHPKCKSRKPRLQRGVCCMLIGCCLLSGLPIKNRALAWPAFSIRPSPATLRPLTKIRLPMRRFDRNLRKIAWKSLWRIMI